MIPVGNIYKRGVLLAIACVIMGKPRGSIGETKLKILSILRYNEILGAISYGYGIWKTMKDRYYSSLSDDGLRNIYHHLEDLRKLGLVTNCSSQSTKCAPIRRLYGLTNIGRNLEGKYTKYLQILQRASQV